MEVNIARASAEPYTVLVVFDEGSSGRAAKALSVVSKHRDSLARVLSVRHLHFAGFFANALEKRLAGVEADLRMLDPGLRSLLLRKVASGIYFYLHPYETTLAIDVRGGAPAVYPALLDAEARAVHRLEKLRIDEETALHTVVEVLAELLSLQDQLESQGGERLSELRKKMLEKELESHKSVARAVLSSRAVYSPEEVRKVFRKAGATEAEDALYVPWVERAYGLEEEGRELALSLAQVEREAGEELYKALDRVAKWCNSVADAIDELSRRGLPAELKSFATKLRDLFTALRKAAEYGVLHPSVSATLRELDAEARKLVGRGALWGEPTTFTSVVNSATSAFHALVEYVQGRFIGRAVLLARDRELGEELAGTFFKTIEEMLRRGLYILPDDLRPTHIVVRDSEVVVRLGSATGHAARIDMERGVLRYFDMEEDVKEVVLELVKEFVPVKSYEITDEELVVYFEPSRENAKRLVAVLPLAISMDVRLENALSKPLSELIKQLLSSRGIDKALEKLEELGIPKSTVLDIAKKIQQAFKDIRHSEFTEYAKTWIPEAKTVLEDIEKELKKLVTLST